MSDTEAAAAAAAAAAAFRESTIEGWTLYAIGVVFTILRTYARVVAVGWKRLQADDYLAWVAVALYSAQTTLAYFIGKAASGLANNGMTDEERAALSPDSDEYQQRIIGSKIQVAGWTTYSTMIWTLKLSLLVFYLRLTQGLGRRYRLRIHIGFGLVVTTFLATIVCIFAPCQPFNHYWQINPDPGNVCQAAVSEPILWSSFIANVSTDIYLIFIPIPLLWESSLSLVKKIASTIVLGSGIFVLVCAIIKSVSVITDPEHGGELAAKWGTRETFVAVVTTNLPMILPLLRQYIKPLIPAKLRSTQKAHRTPPGFQTIGGGDGSGGYVAPNSRNRPTPRSNVTMTNISFTESEERMMNDIKMQEMKIYAEPAPVGSPQPASGIMVSNEFDLTTQTQRSPMPSPSQDPKPMS